MCRGYLSIRPIIRLSILSVGTTFFMQGITYEVDEKYKTAELQTMTQSHQDNIVANVYYLSAFLQRSVKAVYDGGILNVIISKPREILVKTLKEIISEVRR